MKLKDEKYEKDIEGTINVQIKWTKTEDE